MNFPEFIKFAEELEVKLKNNDNNVFVLKSWNWRKNDFDILVTIKNLDKFVVNNFSFSGNNEELFFVKHECSDKKIRCVINECQVKINEVSVEYVARFIEMKYVDKKIKPKKSFIGNALTKFRWK